MRWLQRARLRRAQWLLETSSLSVDNIRREAGFASSSTFRQAFRGYTGLSPQAYRQAHRRGRTPRPRQQSIGPRHTDVSRIDRHVPSAS
jgi:transcriptional regulator GlxA family with amidase domain